MNIPNILTLLRIITIPALVVLYYWQQTTHSSLINTIMVVVFCVASLTDYIDGYLARRLNISTQLGAFLDPVADKLIVTTALIILVDYYHNFYVLIPVLVIVIREIMVSALREWMEKVKQGDRLAVSFLGKVKTTIQLIAIAFLLDTQDLLGISSYQAGLLLLYIAMLLTLYSGFIYLLKSVKTFDT